MSTLTINKGQSTSAIITIHHTNCCACGTTLAMEDALYKQRKLDKKFFYCPNGHPQFFIAETEAEKLQRQLNVVTAQRDAQTKRADRNWEEAERQMRRVSAHRGMLTRVRKKIHKGNCPRCKNRHFNDLARHMALAHPKGI